MKKSDGGYLYSTTDLAAIYYRSQILKADRIIYVHDSRQTLHFNQVFALAKKAGWADHTSLEFAAFGTMLGPDGKPFKTRSGETVKLKDLLHTAIDKSKTLLATRNQFTGSDVETVSNQIGIGTVKCADLSKDRMTDYVFNLDQMLSFDGNTAPHLQYAYTRIMSIFKKAGLEVWSFMGKLDITEPQELVLAKHLMHFDHVLIRVGSELKPNLLCEYLYTLVSCFSSFYENCPVVSASTQQKQSRLMLCKITSEVLKFGLSILGISCPEKM